MRVNDDIRVYCWGDCVDVDVSGCLLADIIGRRAIGAVVPFVVWVVGGGKALRSPSQGVYRSGFTSAVSLMASGGGGIAVSEHEEIRRGDKTRPGGG